MNTTKKLNTVSSTSFQCGCTLLHHPGYGPGGEASLTCQVVDVDKELNQRVQVYVPQNAAISLFNVFLYISQPSDNSITMYSPTVSYSSSILLIKLSA